MWREALYTFLQIGAEARHGDVLLLALKFFPYALLLEFPLYLLVLLGIVRYRLRRLRRDVPCDGRPRVSCIITCYNEGEAVRKAIVSLLEQDYPGEIEIIPVIDGALENAATLRVAQLCREQASAYRGRRLLVVPKWQRGGRVSSLNSALLIARGDIVVVLDGDTSVENDVVRRAASHFEDPDVVGVAGNLRVRNRGHSLATRLQALEYLLSIGAGKTGLSEFNVVNNISGAFGVFRASFLRRIGGWDAGAAEDLDLTLRIKQYFGRHERLRIVFDPLLNGHTDVPETFGAFFRQRWRWDGDLFYLYVRKYRTNLRPRLFGWRNFGFLVYGGLIQQLVLPFGIVCYTFLLFLVYPGGPLLGILSFVYFVYFLALAQLYLLYIVAVSNRPREDLSLVPLLPLFPLFAFVTRVNGALAILMEIFLRRHRDSPMAPPWVLQRTKF